MTKHQFVTNIMEVFSVNPSLAMLMASQAIKRPIADVAAFVEALTDMCDTVVARAIPVAQVRPMGTATNDRNRRRYQEAIRLLELNKEKEIEIEFEWSASQSGMASASRSASGNSNMSVPADVASEGVDAIQSYIEARFVIPRRADWSDWDIDPPDVDSDSSSTDIETISEATLASAVEDQMGSDGDWETED
jgi:hypothetical protein